MVTSVCHTLGPARVCRPRVATTWRQASRRSQPWVSGLRPYWMSTRA